MLHNAACNRFWLLTGLETIALGVFFMLAPNYIHDGGPFHSAVMWLDDPIPVLILLSVGFFTVILSCFDMNPNWHRGNIIALQAIWSIYAAAFLIRDLNDPRPPMVGLATILFWAIVLRIYVEGLVGEPGDKDLERRGGERRMKNLSKP